MGRHLAREKPGPTSEFQDVAARIEMESVDENLRAAPDAKGPGRGAPAPDVFGARGDLAALLFFGFQPVGVMPWGCQIGIRSSRISAFAPQPMKTINTGIRGTR